MKIEGDESIKIDQIKVPRLKEGSHVYIHSVYNRRDYHVLEVMKCDSSAHDDKVEINLELLKQIKNSNDPDSSIIIKPYDLSKHRYGFVCKKDGLVKCLNVKNPKPIKYFQMKWDDKNIPDGIDSVITRMEDDVCGCLWKNGCMVIDFDNAQVKADIEKYGFEELIRINMLELKTWNEYTFNYFDLNIINTLDVLELFPKFFKSESDDYESLKKLIDQEESEIIVLIKARKNIKQMMMRYKNDPDKFDRLYKKSTKLKYEINSRITKYDDEFIKVMGDK
jgi:hypothetical protein